MGAAGGGAGAVLPGRPPLGLSRMLRMYVAQQCFGLSDEGIEDALYDSQAIRRFVGIDLAREAAPDATTLCTNPDSSSTPICAFAPKW